MKVPIFEKKFKQKFTKYSNNKNYLLDNYRHFVARAYFVQSPIPGRILIIIARMIMTLSER